MPPHGEVNSPLRQSKMPLRESESNADRALEAMREYSERESEREAQRKAKRWKLGPLQIDPVRVGEIIRVAILAAPVVIPVASSVLIGASRVVRSNGITQHELDETNKELKKLREQSDEMNRQIGTLQGQLAADHSFMQGFVAGEARGKTGR